MKISTHDIPKVVTHEPESCTIKKKKLANQTSESVLFFWCDLLLLDSLNTSGSLVQTLRPVARE